MLCPGANCGIILDRKRSEMKQAIAYSCFPVFQTSQMFRLEALGAYVRVNTWDVQPNMLLIPHSWPAETTESGLSTESRQGLRNFYMRVDLCSAGFDLLPPGSVQLPPGLNRSDKLACRRWIYQTRENQPAEKQTEAAVCCKHLARLDGFASSAAEATSNPRALTIDVVIHHGVPPRNPMLDQCGLTLKIELKFLTGGLQHPDTLQLGPTDALKVVQQNFNKPLEHRRRFLAPLLRLQHIQKISVRRSWTVHYRKTTVLDGSEGEIGSILRTETIWKTTYMGHYMEFKSAFALLEALGKDFRYFTTTGLRQMGIAEDEVVAYEENSPWNDKTVIVPPAPPSYFRNGEASF